MADPALVDACKPHVKNLVKAITGLLARLTGNASMRATDEEAELLAETGAPLMVLHMPDVAQASPEAAFGAAVLNYAVPRLGAFSGTPDVASTGASSPPPPPPPPSPAPAPSETAVVVSPLMPTARGRNRDPCESRRILFRYDRLWKVPARVGLVRFSSSSADLV
jgi:hypothetical protein